MSPEATETVQHNGNQRFWLAFEHANVGMALVMPGGPFLRANPSLCRILGYAERQLKELDVQSITHRDDTRQEMRLIKQALEGKVSHYSIEKHFVKSDGTQLLAAVSATLERDRTGQPLHFIYIVSPINLPATDGGPLEGKGIKPEVEAPNRLDPATESPSPYEEIFFRFLEAVPMSLFIVDGAGLPYYANKPARELLGIGAGSTAPDGGPLAGAYAIFVAGTDNPYPEEGMPMMRAVYGESTSVEDMEIRQPDRTLSVHSWGAPIFSSEGEVLFSVGGFTEISERKAALHALEVAHDRYKAICDNISHLVTVHDLQGFYRFANSASTRLLGYEPAELVGTDTRAYIHPDDLPIVGKTFQRHLAGSDEHMRATYRVRLKTGEYCWVETGARPIIGTYGPSREILCVTHTIEEGGATEASLLVEGMNSEEKKREQEMLPYMDALTGLKNRRAVDEQIQKRLSSRRASGYPLGCLMIDVDRLRSINDKYGHTTGDDVLKKIALVISNACRTEDFVGRYGEDEFIVLLANTDAAGTVIVGEKLLSRVNAAYWADTPVLENVTISIGGICINRYVGLTQGDLLETLDAQLYEAKQGGRNRMVMNARRAVRSEWASLSER